MAVLLPLPFPFLIPFKGSFRQRKRPPRTSRDGLLMFNRNGGRETPVMDAAPAFGN